MKFSNFHFKTLISILVLSFFSCSESKESVNPNSSNSFTGFWNLIKVSGGFSKPQTILKGKIRYNFKTDSVSILISDAAIPSPLNFPYKNDTTLVYNFSDDTIKICNITYDYQFTDSALLLDDGLASDGSLYELVR